MRWGTTITGSIIQYLDLAKQGAVFRDPRLVAMREHMTADEIGVLARQAPHETFRENRHHTCLNILWKRHSAPWESTDLGDSMGGLRPIAPGFSPQTLTLGEEHVF